MVESASLLNSCPGNWTAGSNPVLSAWLAGTVMHGAAAGRISPCRRRGFCRFRGPARTGAARQMPSVMEASRTDLVLIRSMVRTVALSVRELEGVQGLRAELRSQIRIVLSALPMASREPSGFQATPRTGLVCFW